LFVGPLGGFEFVLEVDSQLLYDAVFQDFEGLQWEVFGRAAVWEVFGIFVRVGLPDEALDAVDVSDVGVFFFQVASVDLVQRVAVVVCLDDVEFLVEPFGECGELFRVVTLSLEGLDGWLGGIDEAVGVF